MDLDQTRAPGSALYAKDQALFEGIRAAIEQATGDHLNSPDLNANKFCVELIDQVRVDEILNEVIFFLTKRLSHCGANTAILIFFLLGELMNSGCKRWRKAVNSKLMADSLYSTSKRFLSRSGSDNQRAANVAWELIKHWGERFLSRHQQYSHLVELYFTLRREGLPFNKKTKDPVNMAKAQISDDIRLNSSMQRMTSDMEGISLRTTSHDSYHKSPSDEKRSNSFRQKELVPDALSEEALLAAAIKNSIESENARETAAAIKSSIELERERRTAAEVMKISMASEFERERENAIRLQRQINMTMENVRVGSFSGPSSLSSHTGTGSSRTNKSVGGSPTITQNSYQSSLKLQYPAKYSSSQLSSHSPEFSSPIAAASPSLSPSKSSKQAIISSPPPNISTETVKFMHTFGSSIISLKDLIINSKKSDSLRKTESNNRIVENLRGFVSGSTAAIEEAMALEDPVNLERLFKLNHLSQALLTAHESVVEGTLPLYEAQRIASETFLPSMPSVASSGNIVNIAIEAPSPRHFDLYSRSDSGSSSTGHVRSVGSNTSATFAAFGDDEMPPSNVGYNYGYPTDYNANALSINTPATNPGMYPPYSPYIQQQQQHMSPYAQSPQLPYNQVYPPSAGRLPSQSPQMRPPASNGRPPLGPSEFPPNYREDDSEDDETIYSSVPIVHKENPFTPEAIDELFEKPRPTGFQRPLLLQSKSERLTRPPATSTATARMYQQNTFHHATSANEGSHTGNSINFQRTDLIKVDQYSTRQDLAGKPPGPVNSNQSPYLHQRKNNV